MKYSGKLGVAEQVEVSPGVWEEVITEQDIVGDLLQRTEALSAGENVLPRYVTTTSVSVLALAVGQNDTSMFRYLTLAGTRWAINSWVAQPPRLVAYFGEEYHGPIPK